MIKKQMNETEMLDCLQAVWENMTMDKNREAYQKILILLENMAYYLSHDLGIEYSPETPSVGAGEFDF